MGLEYLLVGPPEEGEQFPTMMRPATTGATCENFLSDYL